MNAFLHGFMHGYFNIPIHNPFMVSPFGMFNSYCMNMSIFPCSSMSFFNPFVSNYSNPFMSMMPMQPIWSMNMPIFTPPNLDIKSFSETKTSLISDTSIIGDSFIRTNSTTSEGSTAKKTNSTTKSEVKKGEDVKPTSSNNNQFQAKISNKDNNTYNDLIVKYAKQYNVDANLIKAMIKQESRFNPKATSSCGAKGLMQLMPATANSLGVHDAYNPEDNIKGGVKYISQMLKKFNNNVELALAAYNAGAGNVKNGKIPQNGQTPKYVSNVMKYYKEYQKS